MNEGYIKLYRNLLDNPIVSKPDYLAVWIYLLLSASYRETSFILNNKIQTLKAGQLITGRKKISKATGVNELKVYRILNCFENEHQIEQQKNNRFTLITILNWDKFQGNGTTNEHQIEQQMNNKCTTNEQQMNTIQEYKEYKEINNNNINIYAPTYKNKSGAKSKINFNFSTNSWENITEEDIKLWREAYPACDIDITLSQIKDWLIRNPKKKKSNYGRFITNWLARKQDKGGDLKLNMQTNTEDWRLSNG